MPPGPGPGPGPPFVPTASPRSNVLNLSVSGGQPAKDDGSERPPQAKRAGGRPSDPRGDSRIPERQRERERAIALERRMSGISSAAASQ